VSGDPVLADAAVDAVRQWRYQAYDSSAGDLSTRVVVSFVLPHGT